MSNAHLGVLCALLAPLAWSVAIVLYRRTDASPLAMNLFKNVFAAVLLGATMVLIGSGIPMERSGEDWARLVVSGLLGLALADTLLFEGLRRVGAAGIAVVDTIYAPCVVVLSWIVLAEVPTAAFLVGAAAVVVGIGIANIRLGEVVHVQGHWGGMAYGFAAIVCTALAVVIAKPVLEGSELIEVTTTRLVVGVIGQGLWIVGTGRWREAVSALKPAPYWRTLVPAAFVGTYISMVLWLGGFKWADASVAAVLNQMATVYILIQARLVLGEVLRPAQVVGALLAAGGALVIVLSRLL